jgi:hypothetical protein
MHEGLERFEAFKEETRRIERHYWALVRQSERREATFSQLYECSRCGKLSHQNHEKGCFDLKPLDISQEEKLQRMEDPFNANTWDYEAIIDD